MDKHVEVICCSVVKKGSQDNYNFTLDMIEKRRGQIMHKKKTISSREYLAYLELMTIDKKGVGNHGVAGKK